MRIPAFMLSSRMPGVAVVISLLLATPSFSIAEESPAAPTAEVQLPVVWKVGDKVNYKVLKTREQTGRQFSPDPSSTPLEIEVLESREDGYLLGWTYGKVELPKGLKDVANPEVEQLGELFRGFQFRLQLAHPPAIVGVENWQELQGKIRKVMKTMSDLRGENDAEAAAVTGQIMTMFDTKEKVTALATRDAQMFFFAVGGNYSAETYEYEDVLPNPFGGEPFPCKGQLRLKSLDEQQAVISWSQACEPEATLKIIKKIVTDMATRLNKPIKDVEQQIGNFAVTDEGEFRIDRNTGWPIEIKHKRSVRSGTNRRVDILAYRREPIEVN
ncbi:MAG: hypothetical protein KDA87_04230 [Planctomycetales bacterium]|nr:hypothetical protein [Planctomycetales bacterium]